MSGLFLAMILTIFVTILQIAMKLKKYFLSAVLVGGCGISVFSQEIEQKKAGLTIAQQRDLTMRTNDLIAHRRMKAFATATEAGKYNYKENEILAKLNVSSIPADFPVFKKEYTNDQYDILMSKWYELHPSLLKSKNNSN